MAKYFKVLLLANCDLAIEATGEIARPSSSPVQKQLSEMLNGVLFHAIQQPKWLSTMQCMVCLLLKYEDSQV